MCSSTAIVEVVFGDWVIMEGEGGSPLIVRLGRRVVRVVWMYYRELFVSHYPNQDLSFGVVEKFEDQL